MSSRQYLLDTNIISNLWKDPQGKVNQHLQAISEDKICTSIIVAAELRFGAAKRQSQALTEWVEAILSRLTVLALKEGVDQEYAKIRSELEQSGQLIGSNDLLIAAHARYLGFTLVTDNVREFQRVSNLPVENWLV
ncbi:MAG: type II toxin-antitoxin system VapC family toxin [Thiolinea sp.]